MFRANSKVELTRSVESALVANGLAASMDLAIDIENCLCQSMVPGDRDAWCKPLVTRGYIPKPGDVLRNLIHSITGKMPTNNCSCAERVRRMNEWGWVGCLLHKDTIIGWLSDEARKRGHALSDDSAFELLKAGLSELRTRAGE